MRGIYRYHKSFYWVKETEGNGFHDLTTSEYWDATSNYEISRKGSFVLPYEFNRGLEECLE